MQNVEKNYDIYHRKEIEEIILSGIICLDAGGKAKEIVLKHQLRPKDFNGIIYQAIFEAILECYSNKLVANLQTVSQFRPDSYRHHNADVFYKIIIELTQKHYYSLATLESYIMILKQYVLFDYWNNKAHDILYGNWEGRDVLIVGDNIINSYNLLFKRLTENLTKNDANNYEAEIIGKVNRKLKGLSTGITTAVEAIDSFTGGYSLGELIIIAARPGMGKTTYALISGWLSAMKGNPTVFFSLEMPKNQLKSKLISLITNIDYQRIKKGDLTSTELQQVLSADKYIDNSSFYIEDKLKTIEQISEKSKWYAEEKGVKLVMLDYIQRTKSTEKLQMRELVTVISRECKSIATDNYIAVVALSQLNRGVESRDNKRPRLSDLKESSSIEEDADIVAFLFRQAYYDQQAGQIPGFAELFHTEFIIAKGRDLGTKTIHLFINPIDMTINSYNYSGVY